MQDLDTIQHTVRRTKGGGMVLVLETGALIDPEAQAMLGALHSRSIGGIQAHLKVLAEKGAKNFMSKFYVGYGHKSIGDMGSITVFIEGVSMLAAKAIQDFRLYKGQEASTRYIDFADQTFIDPLGTRESHDILEKWRSIYLEGLEELLPYLQERYPLQQGENAAVHEKALKARAFDIMRSLLPAGASTNLAWHGPVRDFADRLPVLRAHPLQEVRDIAEALEEALLASHPNSFSDKHYEATDAYLSSVARDLAYITIEDCAPCELTRNTLDKEMLSEYAGVLSTRPNGKTELPKALEETGELQFTFLLDFGSFRDIQRHRGVIQRMPLLSTRYGFHPWYFSEMPDNLVRRIKGVLSEQEKSIQNLTDDSMLRQYYCAMGYQVTNRLTGSLPALIYLLELRSGPTVHPTLRVLSQEMGKMVEGVLKPYNAALFIDHTETRFDVSRGKHDIVLKA